MRSREAESRASPAKAAASLPGTALRTMLHVFCCGILPSGQRTQLMHPGTDAGAPATNPIDGQMSGHVRACS